MANIFSLETLKNPLQALKGEDNAVSTGPLHSVELAKDNTAASKLAADPNWQWVGEDIDATRWDKNYPYQLLMLEKSGQDHKIKATFTLPIAPQDMSISMPFAISTSVTLGGIIEEHNGAPLRMISFSGTTGVMPLKGSGQGLKQGSIVAGIFAGTVNAVGNLVAAGKTLVGKGPDNSNLFEGNDDNLKASGYYQFRLLQRFLESYATKKRDGKNDKLRLALAIWKDQAVYLVTPMSFDVRRSAQSPWEYNFSMQLKAWRRIKTRRLGQANEAFKSITRDPNAFAQLLNKVQDARKVLQESRDVLLAVRSDTDRVLLEPLREVVLFSKDAIGLAATAADFPSSISSSFQSAILEANMSFNALGQGISDLSVESGKAVTGGGSQHPASPVSQGGRPPPGKSQSPLTGASPANKTLANPGDNFELMDSIKPSSLNLSPAIQKKILEERRRVRLLTRLDFETYRNQFAEFQAQFADAVGAGSATYNAIYNRPTVVANKTPTQDDYDVLFSLNKIILEMNRLAASYDVDDDAISTIEAVAGMARGSGIAFQVPASKFAIPFPYGSTLEQLSAQYLGTPDRWHEIVALNGLRQPYIDEVGFDLKLLVNGRGNIVIVQNADSLYVGQPVWLSGTNTNRAKRRITKIERIAGTATLTVDGDPDLDRFSVLAGAVLHAFLPDTVNSQQLIYIPSDEVLGEDAFRTKSIPGIDEFDPLIEAGGVDLLLTQNGDLAVTPDGDCRLAIGLTNLIQRIRTAIGTPRGALLHHPEYGVGLVPGVSTADLDASQMKASLQDLLSSDSAFSGVGGVSISKAGPVARVSMSVGISGTNQTIPVTVDIRR